LREGEDPLRPSVRERLQACLNLAARGLMQRATARPGVRGWRPPPFAYVLTCEGWALVKAERQSRRRIPAMRQTS
ncbi:MAG: hypothetical protein ABW042_05505, partial [Phenylobacterium sp.]